ncbi:MAG: hypothetical protein AABW65_00505 [Nanoarchaeota archaeon]
MDILLNMLIGTFFLIIILAVITIIHSMKYPKKRFSLNVREDVKKIKRQIDDQE